MDTINRFTIKRIHSGRVYAVFLVCILVIGLWLRFYRIQQNTELLGDQGRDLFIARRIVENGLRPLIGSPLSVENLHTPPTYYYILSAALLVGKSPENITVIFSILNFISLLALYKLAHDLFDTPTALLTATAYGIANVAMLQERSMWSANPPPIFIVFSLLFLYVALQKNRADYMLMSLAIYFISLSIYPSPFLLLPYFLSKLHAFSKKPILKTCHLLPSGQQLC